MDGLFHGKPYVLMDDLGVPLFSETSICPKQPVFFFIAQVREECLALGPQRNSHGGLPSQWPLRRWRVGGGWAGGKETGETRGDERDWGPF